VQATSAATSLDDASLLASTDESAGVLESAPPSFTVLSSPPTHAVHKKIAVIQRIDLPMSERDESFQKGLQLTTICSPLSVHAHTRFTVGGAAQSHE